MRLLLNRWVLPSLIALGLTIGFLEVRALVTHLRLDHTNFHALVTAEYCREHPEACHPATATPAK